VFVEPAQTPQTATIVVDDLSDLGHLMVRGWQHYQIEVVAISTFIAEPAAQKEQSGLLGSKRKRLSISECDVILRGGETVLSSGSVKEPGIEIVPV